MGVLEVLAIMAMLFLGAILLLTYKNTDRAMAVLIGVSGGLVGMQVMRVHAFTILLVLWFLMPNGPPNRGSGGRIAALATASAILATTTLYGDLVVSPTLALQLIGLTASAAIIIAKSTQSNRQDMLFGLLAVLTASSFLGVLQVAKIAPIEIWHAHVSSVGRPIGFYPEPDWLGMFAGIGLIMAWRLPIGRPSIRTLCIALNAAAFVFAFARAAWIGVGASIALIIVAGFFARRAAGSEPKEVRTGRWPALGLMVAGGATFIASNPKFADDFVRRLQGTFTVSSQDISGQARVRQIDGLWQMAKTAPWYGHGLSANGRVGIWGDYNSGDASDSTNAVNSNWLLSMWVDGKYMALPLILLLIGVAIIACRSIAGQMLVVVLLSSLFSNATFQPVTWLLVGLAMSASWDTPMHPPSEPHLTKSTSLRSQRSFRKDLARLGH